MPHRFNAALAYISYLMATAIEGAAASAVILDQTIWADTSLRAWCVIGSILGGTLAICIWLPDTQLGNEWLLRRILIKFLGSSISGLLFTAPALIYFGWRVNVDNVLSCSGAVAFSSVWLIHKLMPKVEPIIDKVIAKWTK